MKNYTLPIYEQYRTNINNFRNNKQLSWEEIEFAGKGNDEALQLYLDGVAEFCSCNEIDVDDWKALVEIAKKIEELPFAILDINMGCPVPKIVKNGEGSALMKNSKLVYEIVSKTVKAIKKPVTVKIRKGFDDTCINAVEIAKVIEDALAANGGVISDGNE